MVYGGQSFHWGTPIGYDIGIDRQILPLFAARPDLVIAKTVSGTGINWYWLRDVASSTGFADVSGNGYADACGASGSGGCRFAFLLH